MNEERGKERKEKKTKERIVSSSVLKTHHT
jgi:hypothetical protein